MYIFLVLTFRSGSQHNHHSQQRMNYGQNRSNFHNGGHNMHGNHGPNSVASTQSQQQSNLKIEPNIGNSSQSNTQPRYKPMESSNLSNQQHITIQKKPITILSNSENVHKTTELNHGCTVDENSVATSTNPSKTKTPMCLINELVRAHQVCFIANQFMSHVTV